MHNHNMKQHVMILQFYYQVVPWIQGVQLLIATNQASVVE